jgi:CheY-like chemotaxis protein
MNKLLLIEDDPFMIEWVERLMKSEGIEVDCIKSERAFLVRQEHLQKADYRAIVVDLMLPWEDGVPLDSQDRITPRGDYSVAGERIVKDLRNNSNLRDLPILLYTVNDKPAFDDIDYMRKDEPDEKFVSWVNTRRPASR